MHIQQAHVEKTKVINKCDSCSADFNDREHLIRHIEQQHCNKQITNDQQHINQQVTNDQHIIQRYICAICNVEVHGNSTMENHVCRRPEWTCHVL